MALQDLNLAGSYRSARHVLARDFYMPCLREAQRYDRATGYFSSSSLAVVADALPPFLERDGVMRLVASPHLSVEDAQAILHGYRSRDEVVARAAARVLQADSIPDPEQQRLAFLAWLIAQGRLEIRLALIRGEDSVGLYHEKFGILEDSSGAYVAFSGSANESRGGLESNFEAIDVFRSWEPADVARADQKRAEFEELWSGRVPLLDLYEFPEAARARLLEFRPPDGRRPRRTTTALAGMIEAPTDEDPFGFPILPPGFVPRPYQREAVEAWLGANGRGIFEMATGTGKTLTALSAVAQVARMARKQDRRLTVIVVCPLRHLVTQWAKDARWFAMKPILAFESADSWTRRLSDAFSALRNDAASFVSCITTNVTFSGRRFQDLLATVDGPLMIIVDEMHNAGSEQMRERLPTKATFRLGLSATPERWMDEEGTAELFSYFGDKVFSFPLDKAVTEGILSPYRYHPIAVPLSDEELETYQGLSQRIGQLMAGQNFEDPASVSGELKMLLFARARLLGGASGKIPALKTAMTGLENTTHNLIYCSDASISDEPDVRQLEAAVALLNTELGMRVASYTHRDSTEQRRSKLEMFDRGEVQALVAIKCLDEGVDVPSTRRAFILASSTNPRQFIQRRGRVLRRAPGKERADIWDYLAVPPAGALTATEFQTEQRLVRRELVRVIEFTRSAENGPEALHTLLPLRERYELLDVG